MHKILRSLLAAAGLAAAANAFAVTDASGDFLASFTGQHDAALDIVWADVAFDAAHNDFVLRARTAGPIAGTHAAYVFGLDLGGTPKKPFASIGEPGVAFTSAITLASNGTGAVAGTAIATHVHGDEIDAIVPAALLPTIGIADTDVTWALWSIDSTVTGLARNADFAPDGDIRVSAVPEPAPIASMLAGLGLLGFAARRRQAARQR
jgi:hypothetical protein